mmetsp:Transcript_84835/g.240426  ORF Transcript_84835/g.240426 Transcript_84835/m.240426 type:complete len:207 (+) Transcript_84835:354-974(+)
MLLQCRRNRGVFDFTTYNLHDALSASLGAAPQLAQDRPEAAVRLQGLSLQVGHARGALRQGRQRRLHGVQHVHQPFYRNPVRANLRGAGQGRDKPCVMPRRCDRVVVLLCLGILHSINTVVEVDFTSPTFLRRYPTRSKADSVQPWGKRLHARQEVLVQVAVPVCTVRQSRRSREPCRHEERVRTHRVLHQSAQEDANEKGCAEQQ